MKYRKKPVVVEARKWFREGDDKDVAPYYEGTHAAIYQPCEHCQRDMSEHGKIDAGAGELIVCPGDYIVTGAMGDGTQKTFLKGWYNRLSGIAKECGVNSPV